MDELDDGEFKQLNELLSDAEVCSRLTDWEESFLSDMRARVLSYGKRVRISPKQQEILDRIEGKVYA